MKTESSKQVPYKAVQVYFWGALSGKLLPRKCGVRRVQAHVCMCVSF